MPNSPSQQAMQSKYSRIFLREQSSWTAESTLLSTVEPASAATTGTRNNSMSVSGAGTGTTGNSYPPSHDPGPGMGGSSSFSPTSMNMSMSSPQPHPYTLGALHSPVDSEMRNEEEEGQRQRGHSQQETGTTMSEKREGTSNIGHAYPRNAPATRLPPDELRMRRRSIRSWAPPAMPKPLHMRPLLLLLLFLPIPPLLSLLYVVTGHAILLSARTPPSIFDAPRLSSLEAGATGGVILALPIALLLYLLLFPSVSSSGNIAPEDFFDDDSSVIDQARWMIYSGYLVTVLLVVCVGGMAGPLGVTCLSSDVGSNLSDSASRPKILSVGASAAAGLVGGVVLALGGFVLLALGFVAWTVWIRSRRVNLRESRVNTI